MNLIFFLVLDACRKSKENTQCLSNYTAGVVSAIGQDSGAVNQTLDFHVRFIIGAACDHFMGFQPLLKGDTTIISLNIKHLGCVCPALLAQVDTIYQFRPMEAGTYYLKFLQAGETYITDTVNIK